MSARYATSGPWRARPIFVSSTFRDMQAERDHLARFVFPRIEEQLRERRHHLEPIDLRVGVDTATIADERDRELIVLRVCFDEIRRSRPYLLVLLGDRYGWVPPQQWAEAAMQEAGFNARLENKSVTALEIEFGLLHGDQDQKRRCLFFLRNPLPYDTMPPEVAALYSDAHATDAEAPRRAEALLRLKASLKEDPNLCHRIHPYTAPWDAATGKVTGLEAWGDEVFDKLWTLLDLDTADYLHQSAPTWEETERETLAEFIEHLSRGFVGRGSLLAQLQAIVSRSGAVGACITGTEGSGKSALFAQLCRQLSTQRDLLLLAHAAGIGPRTSSVESMLRRWIGELAEQLGAENPIPEKASPDDLDRVFVLLLERASQQQRVVVLVDALNEFEPTGRARRVEWFCGKTWPVNARIIATSLPGKQANALASWAGIEEIELPPLGLTEAEAITRQVWARYHRTVNPVVIKKLTSRLLPDGAPACGNPLWLKLANEQLNLLGADDFGRIEPDNAALPTAEKLMGLLVNTAERLPPDLAGMYRKALVFAEHVHGRPWANSFASLIALSRSGWRESDLLALVPQIAFMIAMTADARMVKAKGEEQSAPMFEYVRDMFADVKRKCGSENGLALTVAAIRRTFRAHLLRRGSEGQWDFFHAQTREVIADLVSSDSREIEMIHLVIALHLDSLGLSDRLTQSEVMYHLIKSWNAFASAIYCCRVGMAGTPLLGLDAKTLYSVASLQRMIKDDPELREIGELSGILAIDSAAAERALKECCKTLADYIEASEPSDPEGDNTILDWVVSWLDLPKYYKNDDLPREFELRLFFEKGLVPALSERGAFACAERLMDAVLRRAQPIDDSEHEAASVLHNRIQSLLTLVDQLRDQGRYGETLAPLREAFKYCNNIVAQFPDSPEYKYDLALVHDRLGAVHHNVGDFREARKELTAAFGIAQSLQRQLPQDARAVERLGWAYERLAILHVATRRPNEALQNWLGAISWFRRAHQQNPGQLENARRSAYGCLQAGLCCLDLADVDKAISLLQQGLETAKRVAILDPDCTESRDLAAKMHSKLSDCLLIKGDLESACKQLEASLQAREDQYARDTADRSAQWGFLLASLKMAQHHALRGAAHRGKVFLDKFSTTLAKCHASLGDEFAELEMQTRMLIREAEEGRRSSAAELRKAMTEMYGTLNRMHRQASSDDRTEAAFSGRAYPDADGTKAAELNIRFQEAVATWSALPWWKRWRVKKPARPKGI